MGINIKCYPYGMYGENTYLITDESTGLKAVVDPGYHSVEVDSDIGEPSSLKYILLTHGHHDHFYAVSDYIEAYRDAVFAAPDAETSIMDKCPKPAVYLREGDVIKVGDTSLRVIETPGHTAGGVCFATDKEIFTGDTLFQMSVGRTDLPTGDWNTLVRSIKNKLYTLDENMRVYPGHGESTTIGFEKKANPFV